MKKLIEAFRRYKSLRQIGLYYFCWIPIDDKGNGLYSVIEFFDDEIQKIDKNKCEIIN